MLQIADFGLSRLVSEGKTHVSTNSHGASTYSRMARNHICAGLLEYHMPGVQSELTHHGIGASGSLQSSGSCTCPSTYCKQKILDAHQFDLPSRWISELPVISYSLVLPSVHVHVHIAWQHHIALLKKALQCRHHRVRCAGSAADWIDGKAGGCVQLCHAAAGAVEGRTGLQGRQHPPGLPFFPISFLVYTIVTDHSSCLAQFTPLGHPLPPGMMG